MLVIVNARERGGDWEALFTDADPRNKFLGVKLPPKSRLWLIEAKWDPERDTGAEETPEVTEDVKVDK